MRNRLAGAFRQLLSTFTHDTLAFIIHHSILKIPRRLPSPPPLEKGDNAPAFPNTRLPCHFIIPCQPPEGLNGAGWVNHHSSFIISKKRPHRYKLFNIVCRMPGAGLLIPNSCFHMPDYRVLSVLITRNSYLWDDSRYIFKPPTSYSITQPTFQE